MYRVYLLKHPEQISWEWTKSALAFLPRERRDRAMRYKHSTDRKNCVAVYFMLKIALKECFGIQEFVLGYGPYGKPYLEDRPEIHFNLSHCKKACGVVVADRPVGMDIEEIRPFSWETAGRVCCRAELKVLEECREKDRSRAFIRMWTMKESYVKQIGRGIGYDVRRVDTVGRAGFGMAEDEEIVVCIYGHGMAHCEFIIDSACQL